MVVEHEAMGDLDGKTNVILSPGMSRSGAGMRAFLVAVVVSLLAGVASAEDVGTLIKRLASSDDFRVRTQAALALGASKNKRAVKPLCKALEDSSTTVRAASAAALGKLRLGGKDCLENRLGEESSSSVKSTIKKALARLGGGDSDGPTIDAKTEVYIAIAKTTDKTGRSGGDVDDMVRAAMSKAATSISGYAVAPKSESTGEAKKLLATYKKAKAFYLSPTVQKPDYNGGNLTIKVEVAIFTYPGKALKGSVPVKLTQQDVSGSDKGAEDELIKMAAERAVEKFSKNVDRIQ